MLDNDLYVVGKYTQQIYLLKILNMLRILCFILSLQDDVYFLMLPFLVQVIFTFEKQDMIKLSETDLLNMKNVI